MAANPKAVKAIELIATIIQEWEDSKISERQMYDKIRVVVMRYKGLIAPPILTETEKLANAS